jgi:hypothetical protein
MIGLGGAVAGQAFGGEVAAELEILGGTWRKWNSNRPCDGKNNPRASAPADHAPSLNRSCHSIFRAAMARRDSNCREANAF